MSIILINQTFFLCDSNKKEPHIIPDVATQTDTETGTQCCSCAEPATSEAMVEDSEGELVRGESADEEYTPPR
jgi:hypothetical protein